MPRNAEATRSFVIAHLHWNGTHHADLTPEQHLAVYCEGDGFGYDPAMARSDWYFDWSHVRDSTPEGFARMADKIHAICTGQVSA